ncbi:MAG: DUF4105 domain-containing protein [Leptospiraceae bacterium]|nr:DUF4105 domain-containing protein [Leptospiraceae bacterium]
MHIHNRAAICFLFLSVFLIIPPGDALIAQVEAPVDNLTETQTWRRATHERFLEWAAQVTPAEANRLNIDIATTTLGPTVTKAFGHTAIRIRPQGAEEFGPDDYYVDFGQYDESAGFIWRFVKGNARFFAYVLPMASAYEGADREGRGLFVSELELTDRQKFVLVKDIERALRDQSEGYEYDNFTNNCVTFIHDLLADATGRNIGLQVPDGEGPVTWRSRVLDYSDDHLALLVNEILLFDADTDVPRKPEELVFLSDDILVALDQSGLIGTNTVLIPHRWVGHNPGLRDRYARILNPEQMNQLFPPGLNQFSATVNWRKSSLLFLMLATLIPMLPLRPVRKYRKYAERLYAVVFGISAIWVTLVSRVTTFQFMDDNILPLVLFPLDFLLWKQSGTLFKKWDWQKIRLYYAAFRAVTLLIALILYISVLPQDIMTLWVFVSVWFALFAWNQWTRLHSSEDRT